MDGQGELRVEVISEIAQWYQGLPSEQQAGVLGEGVESLCRLGREDGGEAPSLREAFLASFAEYALLAVMHGRLDQTQRKLEAEEEALRLRVELLRDGKNSDPGPPRPPSELAVPTEALVIPVAADLRDRLGALAQHLGVEVQKAATQALSVAYASHVLRECDEHDLARRLPHLRGRCAALRFEIWLKDHDNRVTEMHINALRSELRWLQPEEPAGGPGCPAGRKPGL